MAKQNDNLPALRSSTDIANSGDDCLVKALKISDCPPSDAITGPKELFRLVKNDPPTAGDFLTAAQKGIHKDANPCIRHAISTHSDERHADKLRKTVNYFSEHLIAKGTIPAEAGAIKRTGGSGHWSWWPSSGSWHSLFEVVA